MNNVLITGANGFVGSALAEELLHQGCSVVGLVKDRNFKSRRDLMDRMSVVYGDLRDADVVRYAVSHYEVDTIFHVGAITILRMATHDPLTTYQINTMGTVHVLEAARQCKHVKKIVVASSDKAYGVHQDLPYKETHALLASDPYSTSKSCTDLIAQSYAYTYGLDVSVMRSGNIFGPGDLNRSRLIPGAILKILGGQAPVIYKGVAQYKREFMFIGDVVDAYLKVAHRGEAGQAYNIGGAGWATILHTVQMVIEEMRKVGLCDPSMEPEIVEKDFIEIKEQYLDPTKLQGLGWQCKYPLQTGIAESLSWYARYAKDPTKFYYAT